MTELTSGANRWFPDLWTTTLNKITPHEFHATIVNYHNLVIAYPEFMNFDILPLTSVITFTIVLLCHHVVGAYLAPNRLGVLGNSLLGLSVNALVLNLLISFRMDFARIYLLAVLPALFGITLLKFLQRLSCRQFFQITRNFLPVVIVTMLFNFLLSFQDRRLINAHWSYYFGLPAEILKGNYPDRLKVFDNFPIEYPNYHFFNSSQLAIIMRPLGIVDYGDFRLAKIFIIVLFLCVAFEAFRSNSNLKSELLLFSLAIAIAACFIAPNIYWSINTTNYSAGFFLIMFLVFFIRTDYRTSTIWILLFCITSARSVLPGLALWIFSEYRASRKGSVITGSSLRDGHRTWFLPALVNLNIVFMFFSGPPSNSSTFSLILENLRIPYQNFVNPAWLSILSSGLVDSGASLLASFDPLPRSSRIAWQILCILSIYTIYRYSNAGKRATGAILILLTVDFLIFFNAISFVKSTQLLFVIECFLIPILMLFFLSQGNARVVVYLFTSVSLLQLIFLPPDLSVPNWALIEWLWVALLVGRLRLLPNFILLSLACLLLVWLTIGKPPIRMSEWFQPSPSDSTTHIAATGSTKILSKSDCRSIDLALLMSALSGNRIDHGLVSSNRFSVTLGFAQDSAQPVQGDACERNYLID